MKEIKIFFETDSNRNNIPKNLWYTVKSAL